jgi:hypothetical protein
MRATLKLEAGIVRVRDDLGVCKISARENKDQ